MAQRTWRKFMPPFLANLQLRREFLHRILKLQAGVFVGGVYPWPFDLLNAASDMLKHASKTPRLLLCLEHCKQPDQIVLLTIS